VIVIDSSVATKLIFAEEHSGLAESLLADNIARGESAVGPPLLPIEFTNVVRQRMRREGLSYDEAVSALDRFFSQPIAIHQGSDSSRQSLHRRALALAATFDLPAAYDAHYLALAESVNCAFWTADERLLRGLAGRFPLARSLTDYAPN